MNNINAPDHVTFLETMGSYVSWLLVRPKSWASVMSTAIAPIIADFNVGAVSMGCHRFQYDASDDGQAR